MNEDCTLNPMSHIISACLTLQEESVDGVVKTYTTTRKAEQNQDFTIITLYNLCHHPLYIKR